MVAAAAVYHVLTDDHAQTVAVIVPPCTFYLNVLAQHIKAQFFHRPDIIKECLVGGGSIESVRPVSLVQNSHEKIGLVIQAKYRFACGLFNGITAQGKIAFYPVIVKGYLYIIQEGLFGTPAPKPFLPNGEGEGCSYSSERCFP